MNCNLRHPMGLRHPVPLLCKFTVGLTFENCHQRERGTHTHIRWEIPERGERSPSLKPTIIHCNTLQHAATRCNTLQHTATHCNTPQHAAKTHCNTLQLTATHRNTLQKHTATHCNSLQHTATQERGKRSPSLKLPSTHSPCEGLCSRLGGRWKVGGGSL